MSYSSPADILADADTRGLRRALIITALPIEMQAVRAHLRHVGSCLGPDGRVYECGQFTGHADGQTGGKAEEWLVVVAESSVGTHAAQSVVNYAHQMFRPFEVMILVGVAKSQKKEIPIGSVVVSNVVPLCCTDQQPGEVNPRHPLSCEANVLRPPKVQHAVQRCDGKALSN